MKTGLILVHVPDQAVDGRHWSAMGAVLDRGGWPHSVGVCPTSPTGAASPTREALQALGCTTTCQVAELGLGYNAFLLAMAASKIPNGMKLRQVASCFSRSDGLMDEFRQRLRTIQASIDQIIESHTTQGEALVVASQQAWLLLALANLTASDEGSKLAIAELPVGMFRGVGLLDSNQKWLGFYNLC